MVALQLIKNGVNILTMHKLFFVKMSSIFESMQICRLCLVKDQVNVLILAEKTLQKISTCLPIRITKDDQLPKKICETCLYKLDSQYEFWNTTVNAEKQLLSWLSHPETVPEHSIKQEIVDPLEDISENFLPENETPFEKSRSEFLPVENSYYDSIPPKKRKQQAVVKPVQFIALNESENNEKDVDPSCLVTTVLKTEKESENSEAEDIHENIDPINFVLSEIDDKVQPEVFVPQNIVEERPLECQTYGRTTFHTSNYDERFSKQVCQGPKIYISRTYEKSFSCKICPFKCNKSVLFKEHMSSHTGEKLFKCTMCDFTCKEANDLKTHIVSHVGEKIFKCNLCNYKNIEAENLKTHMMIHIGERLFKCNLCEFRCRISEDLENHMFTHTGGNAQKPLKCNLCNYRCSFSAYLKKHMMTHTGEKPYECNTCDYKCNQYSSLKRHMLRHNKKIDKRKSRSRKRKLSSDSSDDSS